MTTSSSLDHDDAVLEQVRKLVVRLAPEGICGECISDKLGFELPETGGNVALELAASNGFRRSKEACAVCGAEKLVIARTG